MSEPVDSRVTQLLHEWSGGSHAALGELMPLVYEELRRLAQAHLRRERSDHTLQRTALANEAFLRLVNQKQIEWQSRGHFLALASTLMRRILVDHARGQKASKRGSGSKAVSLDETAAAFADDTGDCRARLGDALAVAADPAVDLVAIDEALTRFEAIDPRQSRIVELRFFGGLTIEEIAPVLGISEATVKREWAIARAWLRRELA
ncbi:MAG TPA: sigma-70 family RNA polymerase sigma factor [Steroidobacteraceae bacterium]|nr:sigma-70 family RNA polymerase sigma factor [Steroidobacteraceae bacterium]